MRMRLYRLACVVLLAIAGLHATSTLLKHPTHAESVKMWPDIISQRRLSLPLPTTIAALMNQSHRSMGHSSAANVKPTTTVESSCANRHFCFIAAARETHGAELKTLLWSIFTQEGISKSKITVILASWTAEPGHPTPAHLLEQQRYFGKSRVDIVVSRQPAPSQGAALDPDMAGYLSLNRAIEHTQTHRKQCTHIAFPSQNVYSSTFVKVTASCLLLFAICCCSSGLHACLVVKVMCAFKEDVVFVPYERRSKAMMVMDELPLFFDPINHAHLSSVVLKAGIIGTQRFSNWVRKY